MGGKVQKKFGDQLYIGEVTKFYKETGWYRVDYEDGDWKDLEWRELQGGVISNAPIAIEPTHQVLVLQPLSTPTVINTSKLNWDSTSLQWDSPPCIFHLDPTLGYYDPTEDISIKSRQEKADSRVKDQGYHLNPDSES